MEDIVRASIAEVQRAEKSSVTWELDEPFKQSFYTFINGSWQAEKTSSMVQSSLFIRIALYSWNIDFMLPYGNSRMRQAILHLQEHVSRDLDSATVIFLQESTPADLVLLANHPWVQAHFYLTDLNADNWSSGFYGTVTLIDKRLSISDCFRVHYSKTKMQRDAFFIDIHVGTKVVRLCNSHLESMAFEPPMRPHQLALIAQYMHDEDVVGAAVAGDFNAIQDFDRHLHKDNDLKDAYLELNGKEDVEEGYTWGQQAATSTRERFGCSRMDKIFFCGKLLLRSFERFGAGVEVIDEQERSDIVMLGFDKPWITDHLGVKAVFELASEAQRL